MANNMSDNTDWIDLHLVKKKNVMAPLLSSFIRISLTGPEGELQLQI